MTPASHRILSILPARPLDRRQARRPTGAVKLGVTGRTPAELTDKDCPSFPCLPSLYRSPSPPPPHRPPPEDEVPAEVENMSFVRIARAADRLARPDNTAHQWLMTARRSPDHRTTRSPDRRGPTGTDGDRRGPSRDRRRRGTARGPPWGVGDHWTTRGRARGPLWNRW